MATATRNDVHRPSAIAPADYDFVGIEYDRADDIEAVYSLAVHRERINAHRQATGATYSTHRHGGNCHVCGAAAIYTALFWHRPTNTYIRTGFDCAEKLHLGDPVLFRAIRADVKRAIEAKAGKQKAALLLDEAGLAEAWAWASETDADKLLAVGALVRRENAHPDGGPIYSDRREFITLRDIVRNVVRYGSLSDAQADYLRKLVDRIKRAEQLAAERAAEKAAAKPAPTGRLTVELDVLKVEWRDGVHGGSLKMTCKHADGWLCWGTVPGNLELFNVERRETIDGQEERWTEQRGIERGDRVKLTATFTPSDRDPKFAFFKRPKGERV